MQTVVAADLAEHLFDGQFESFLGDCGRVLEDRGILVLYTPNATNIFHLRYAHARKTVWPFNDPTHIGLRSALDLIKRLTKHDFKIERANCLETILDTPKEMMLHRLLRRTFSMISRLAPVTQYFLGGRVCIRARNSRPKKRLSFHTLRQTPSKY